MVKAEYREDTLEHLEDFFEFAPVGMHIVDDRGSIKRANIAEKELLGYFDDPTAYVGRPMADFCADRADLHDILDHTSRGETVLNRHMQMKGATGPVKVIVDVNASLADRKVQMTRWFVRPETPKELPSSRAVQLSEDVAEKIARMSQAEKSEWFDILNDFFDNAPVGVHFVGLNGVMMRANRAEVSLLGYQDDPGSYIGCHVRHIHHETAVVESLLQRLVEGFPVISQAAYLKRRDGKLEPVLIYSGLRLKGGKFQNTRCFLFSDPSPSKPPSATHARGFAWPRNELEGAQ
jgi:PAS domain-containing protein